MELENTNQNCLETIEKNENLTAKQNNFIQTTIGKITNTALDVGLKIILPEYLEEEIIEIKDTLLNNGLKDGIKKAIDSVINLGKNVTNLITGNFEDTHQIDSVLKKGGLLDKISMVFKDVIKLTENKGVINKKTSKKIDKGKDIIIDTISSNIDKEFSEQIKSEKKIKKYIDNWQNYYNEENFKGMEREFNKIEKEIKNIMPFNKTINDIEKIKNINNLIRSKNGEFNLSETEKELIKKLNSIE